MLLGMLPRTLCAAPTKLLAHCPAVRWDDLHHAVNGHCMMQGDEFCGLQIELAGCASDCMAY